MQIFLLDGNVILVDSTHHRLRLGRVLVRLRVLDEERLERAVREQDRAGRFYGPLLGAASLDVQAPVVELEWGLVGACLGGEGIEEAAAEVVIR